MMYLVIGCLFVGVFVCITMLSKHYPNTWIGSRVYRNMFLVSSLLVLWPLTNYSIAYLMVDVAGIMGIYLLPIYQKKQEKEKRFRLLRYEFPIWLRQIQILLQNNNVQHSLEKSFDSSPAIMKEELARLIESLRMDATDTEAYLNFMKDYEIYEISRAMKLLYRYHMVGASESYHQFQRMLEATGKWLRAERKNRNDAKISMLGWIGVIPMFGCTAIFVVMMFLILTNMMKGGVK